jgi:hypothetical protein
MTSCISQKTADVLRGCYVVGTFFVNGIAIYYNASLYSKINAIFQAACVTNTTLPITCSDIDATLPVKAVAFAASALILDVGLGWVGKTLYDNGRCVRKPTRGYSLHGAY